MLENNEAKGPKQDSQNQLMLSMSDGGTKQCNDLICICVYFFRCNVDIYITC